METPTIENTNIYNIKINIYYLDQSNNTYDTDNNIIKLETFDNQKINANDIKFDNINLYEYMNSEDNVNNTNRFHLQYHYNKDNNATNSIYINKDIIAKCKKNFYKDFDKIIDRKQSELLFENFNDIIKEYQSSLNPSIKTKSDGSENKPFAKVQAPAAAPVSAPAAAPAATQPEVQAAAPAAAQPEIQAAAQPEVQAPAAAAAPAAAQPEVQASIAAPAATQTEVQAQTQAQTEVQAQTQSQAFEFLFNYINQLLNIYSATQLNSENKQIHTYLYLYKMLDYIDNNKYKFCNVSNDDKRKKSIEILDYFQKFFMNFETILKDNLKYFENYLLEFKYICDVQNYYDHISTNSTELINYIYMFNNINVLIENFSKCNIYYDLWFMNKIFNDYLIINYGTTKEEQYVKKCFLLSENNEDDYNKYVKFLQKIELNGDIYQLLILVSRLFSFDNNYNMKTYFEIPDKFHYLYKYTTQHYSDIDEDIDKRKTNILKKQNILGMRLQDGYDNYSSFSEKPNIKRKTKTYFGDFFYKTNCSTSDTESMTNLRNDILENIQNKYETIINNIKRENIEKPKYLTEKYKDDKFIFNNSKQEGIIYKEIFDKTYNNNEILNKLKDHDINDDVFFFYNFILLLHCIKKKI